MLSATQRKTLCETLQTISSFKRKMLALKSICYQYTDERRLITKIKEAGITDKNGGGFTDQIYRILVTMLL